MIDRYSTKEMNLIWSEDHKFATFLKIELKVLEIFANLKIVPQADYLKIKQNITFDVLKIKEIEKLTKHDVIAFIKNISENLGEEKKWIHYKLTSTDVVDTANGLLLKEANILIKKALNNFIETLKENALKYKNTLIVGRTHGIHAEPTSFGLKWLLWYDEMMRNKKRFITSANEVEVGKISGAVGNFANISSEVQDLCLKELNLNSAKISTQILQRDIYANYLHTIALIGTTLEKISVEIRTLQRTEIGEVEEKFLQTQKGSSAMPHKKNPISSENITGLARLLRSYVFPAYENIVLWNERDISHSSVERVIFPDATTLIEYILKRYQDVLKNLVVNKEMMLENLKKSRGLIFSQQILNLMIEKGVARNLSYDLVQKVALKSFVSKKDFKELLLKEKEILKFLSKKEINDLFEYKKFLKSEDIIYKRVLEN
ncbi:/ purB / Adenylosuccinate lyase /:202625 Forward [Candidatus Hepatoplasma crinochetorum]|uniref:Adenylosuccinate lyase n=1 Tax=Candidatus Hepatoplasma crinochetorum TaxID=295596 RepID=A0A0G7ZNP6_9MOLU|nr:/ purB / Adenylosuccinate lyase /:202625 Forward [Candidatus Hepatoplasma crinochetorum]